MGADKFVYELRERDFVASPVWYFPMDETTTNELVVRPVVDTGILDADYQIVVRATFVCREGERHGGYLYWGLPAEVQYLMPVMCIGDDALTFWNGMIKPDSETLRGFREVVPGCRFPITYESDEVMGLEPVGGTLEGVYFLDRGKIVVVGPWD